MATRKAKAGSSLSSDELLTRLREPARIAKLAEATVDALREEPLEALLPPEALAGATVRWARQLAAEAAVQERSERALDGALVALSRERRAIGKVVPPSTRKAVLDAADRSFTLDRAVLRKVLDREPVRRLLRELFFDALGAESARAVVGAAAGGAVEVGRHAVAAVVALQFALRLVVGQGHVAALAQGRVAAGAALPNGRIAPAVQEQDDLAIGRKRRFHRLAQQRGEMAFHGPPAALAQEV